MKGLDDSGELDSSLRIIRGIHLYLEMAMYDISIECM
jgi:hypothetical protein